MGDSNLTNGSPSCLLICNKSSGSWDVVCILTWGRGKGRGRGRECGEVFEWVWSVGVVTCTHVHTLISVSGMENDSK